MKWILTIIAAIIGIQFLWFGNYQSFAEEKYKDLQIFAKVLNLVQKYYVVEVDASKLIRGGIKGMLSVLDPHTNYLDPEIFKEFQEETSGEFGGIGIEIGVQEEMLTIISPIEDTPAFKAGVKAGDRIVTINDEPTKGDSLVEAAQKLKGKLGEPIKLGLMRKDFDKPKVFTIVRGKIKIKSVKATDLEDGYLYIRITSFIENTYDDLDKVIKSHLSKYKKVRGVVIDLRNNPGGLLDQAIKISDLFLKEGVIVSTIGRNKKEKDVAVAKKEGTLEDFPMILMLNEYSASASEIFAGAMQDNRRALILGQRSFGKGSVQSVVKLGDGSGLKLTVARYYTPNGTEIQAEGIKPDILVEDVDPEAFEKALIKKNIRRESDMKGHLSGYKEREKQAEPVNMSNVKNKLDLLSKDYQVLQAFNYLKASKVFEREKPSSSIQ